MGRGTNEPIHVDVEQFSRLGVLDPAAHSVRGPPPVRLVAGQHDLVAECAHIDQSGQSCWAELPGGAARRDGESRAPAVVWHGR